MAEAPVAVTFDFWSTIAVPDIPAARRARRRLVIEQFAGHGVVVDPADVERVFDETVAIFDRAWAANEQFTVVDAAQIAWDAFDTGLGASARSEFMEAFVSSTQGLGVDLAPGVADVLAGLHGLGVRLAVICDVGLTPSSILRRYLADHGLLDLFDHLSFSDEVGVYKPAAEIFVDALDGVGGVAPGRAAHIGDLLRTDIAGARGMGMTSVRYRGVHDDAAHHPDAQEADVVLDDHERLLEVLGYG